MHAIHIDRTFIYGDVKIFVARDPHERRFIGVGLSLGARGNVVFIEVRPQTIDDFEAGRIGLPTLIEHHGIGLIFEVPHQAVKLLAASRPHTLHIARPPHTAPTAPPPLMSA